MLVVLSSLMPRRMVSEEQVRRACYFAVLVAESGTTKPQLAVDNWADVTVKFLHHVRNSTERSDFLRFNAYICHVIDDFACFELQH